jgi:SpoVK/Ycf46/Vps4 family AAA+-type ATPase
VFDLAKTWDTVLLLDEADVFLSKRTKDDLVRNAFVAVFLRLLEYYQGILFLTTNRLEEFDEAFQSRIHLTVEYFPLDPVKREGIWRNLLSPIEECHTWGDEIYQRISEELVLNGREIKNLIKTSLAIATHNGTELTEENLRLIYSFNHQSVKNWG